MAVQAERVCAVCGKPIDVPRQSANDETLCSTCVRLRRRNREKEDRQFDVDARSQNFGRPDYDLHPPGAI
jgi:hypothetical protein